MEHEATRQEGQALRREISQHRAAILTLIDYAEAESLAGPDWLVLADEARHVAACARHLRKPLASTPIAARLGARVPLGHSKKTKLKISLREGG